MNVGARLAVVSGLIVTGGVSGQSATLMEGPPQSVEQPAATKPDIEDDLAAYVMAQEALAADDYLGAQAALERLVAVADGATMSLAQAAAQAVDIESMRREFKLLSEHIMQMPLPTGFGKAYCPMYQGGSNWVQSDGPVRNPYFGQSMLTCGVMDAVPGAHMDHSPRHGGVVFMAPDGFHHIEGSYPTAGVLRVYVTDNYREPVNVLSWTGRAVLQEEYDPGRDVFLETIAFPLVASPEGEYVEAQIGDVPLPAQITAKLIVQPDFPEDRFDFIFATYSKEGEGFTPLSAMVRMSSSLATSLAERIRPEIPTSQRQIVSEIVTRDQEVQELIGSGAYTGLFLPALQAKHLALGLDTHWNQLSMDDRNALMVAVRGVVRGAWLLDLYGDLGNKIEIDKAYRIFGASIGQIRHIYDSPSEKEVQ